MSEPPGERCGLREVPQVSGTEPFPRVLGVWVLERPPGPGAVEGQDAGLRVRSDGAGGGQRRVHDRRRAWAPD